MRRRSAGLAILFLLVSACLAEPDPATPQVPAGSPTPLTVSDAVRIDREQPAREPAILETPDGSLWVAGFWGFARHTEYRGTAQNIAQGPLVWKSQDSGKTWRRLAPGTPVDGAVSNSDLDLAADAKGGFYLTALSYYSVPTPVAPPADPATTLTVVVGATLDGGATWRWTRLDQGSARSHPWVAADPAGNIHVVWSDGQGIRHSASADRGATWRTLARVHATASEAGGIVAAPDGTLAVRTTSLSKPPGPNDDGIAVSKDGGATWTFRPVPAQRASSQTPRGFDGASFDGAGRLYYAWADGTEVFVADSVDHGHTWRVHVVVEEPEGASPYFPYLRAGPAGEIALTWFRRTGDAVAPRVAHGTHLDTDAPMFRIASFVEKTGGTNHADYYQATILRAGGIAAAVPMTTPDLGQWFEFRTAT